MCILLAVIYNTHEKKKTETLAYTLDSYSYSIQHITHLIEMFIHFIKALNE